MNFSSLFLSLKRLREIIDSEYFAAARLSHSVADEPTQAMNHIRIINDLERGVAKWLENNSIPTLGELIIMNKLIEGAFFTHYGPFFGKGTTTAASKYAQGKPVTEARLHAKLEDLHEGATITSQVHPENYTSCSAAIELSGQKRLFMIGRLTSSALPSLEAQAYAIGFLHQQERSSNEVFGVYDLLSNHMEVYVGSIDCFALVRGLTHVTAKEMNQLKSIPETEIKSAFADIIGEIFVPKDWGGESSDLQTTRLTIDGKAFASAFIFKGPSKFKPLIIADLGKNGDQIYRLFSEPVDMVVVQHCHKITSSVRAHMRAFATRVGHQRPFCLVDGADTVRILKAYQKCGYTV